MGLNEYKRKRDFKKTKEPAGGKSTAGAPLFVVQEHHASHLHYDFRLEAFGVLKSWAVPKGPSVKVGDKRLAIEVEDHPIDYANFKGRIPEGEYGAGVVKIWDKGVWVPPHDLKKQFQDGHLEFEVKGRKLKGKWLLQRLKQSNGRKNQWLLIKRHDALKKPSKNKKNKEVPTEKVFSITHPERVIYPKEDIKKIDVANYYETLAPWLLKHISGRPLSLMRCPQKAGESCFFQKHIDISKMPEVRETQFRNQKVFSVNSEKGLLQLVQWGMLELHTWQCHIEDPLHPDQMVFDLDPEEGVAWSQVREAALQLKDLLESMNLKSFLKTTGGKGLHLHVPIAPLYSWEHVRNFAKDLCQQMESERPEEFTTNSLKKKRKNKIFLDYLRNSFGATAVAPFSLRSKDHPTVAMPLDWKELKDLKGGADYDFHSSLRRLSRQKKNPWEKYSRLKQKIK